MAERTGRRINTVCIELVRGTLSGATINVLLPGIIRDAYGIPNEELYGIALNGLTRIFVKFVRAGFYTRIIENYQEQRVSVNSAVDVVLHDVSKYFTWVKVRNAPYEATAYGLQEFFSSYGKPCNLVPSSGASGGGRTDLWSEKVEREVAAAETCVTLPGASGETALEGQQNVEKALSKKRLEHVVVVEVHQEDSTDSDMCLSGSSRKRTAVSEIDEVITPGQRPGKKSWAGVVEPMAHSGRDEPELHITSEISISASSNAVTAPGLPPASTITYPELFPYASTSLDTSTTIFTTSAPFDYTSASFTPNATVSTVPYSDVTTTPAQETRCQTTDDTDEGIPMCQRDVDTIIHELNSLRNKYTEDFKEGETSQDKERITKKYMEDVLEVLDRSDPHRWTGVNEVTRARASTLLQKSLTFAALALASFLSNYTVDYNSTTSDSLISRQSPSYFTDLNRKYQHYNFNHTSIDPANQFYENYIDHEAWLSAKSSSTNLPALCRTTLCAQVLPSAPLAILMHEPDFRMPRKCVQAHDPSKASNVSEISATLQANSPIIGSTVKEPFTWKSARGAAVRMKLQHIYSGDIYLLGPATCVWWDNLNDDWSAAGCWVEEQTDHYTRCACDHLTDLSVLMDIYGVISKKQRIYLRWISIIGCSVSIVCLTLCVLCLSLVIRSKKKHVGQRMNKIHLHLCVCLGVAEVVLLSGLDATTYPWVCTLVAALLHYLFLATFTWSAIEALNLYLMLGKVFATINPMKYFLMVGYGFPLVFVSLSLLATQTQGYGTYTACFLAPGRHMWIFAGPLLLILLVSLLSYTS
nr:uncharacterized protein LOC128693117 [Cherax quadricarinatus]